MKLLRVLEKENMCILWSFFFTCDLVVVDNEEDAINKVVEYYRRTKFN